MFLSVVKTKVKAPDESGVIWVLPAGLKLVILGGAVSMTVLESAPFLRNDW